MPANYKLLTVPLHVTDPREAPANFDVRIVSILEFPEGTTTAADIANSVASHPVLGRQAGQPIVARVVPLESWIASGKPSNTPTGIAVELSFGGTTALATLREVLASYLSRPADVAVSALQHDSRFDTLREQDFLDINRLHDDLWLLRTYVYANAIQSLGFTASTAADPFSVEQARWLNSYVQTAALEAIFGNAGNVKLFANNEVGAAAVRLREDVKKLQARLEHFGSARAFAAEVGLRSMSDAGVRSVAISDPNVAIHAALKNALLSESCGITTIWRARTEQPVIGDHVLFLQAESFSPTPYAVVLQPTAFRREGYTHPLSFADLPQAGQPVRTTNAALAYLNDEHGNPRYRATAINAEIAVIQGTLLQFNNSLSNTADPLKQQVGDFKDIRDDRPPQLLVDEHRGVNELECVGLTISAPTGDLVTPDPLRDPQRDTLWPCLFLEDLWIGFRLDLADDAEPDFSSVHQQVQELTFSTTKRTIKGSVEDFFAREQPANAPTATSTELIRYIGMSRSQAQDYLRFLGKEPATAAMPEAPFTTSVVGYSGATALLFGRIYRYRLRNVLVAGISLSAAEADALPLGASHAQSCPFYRARAYRPGELVSTRFNNANEASRSIYLTEEAPRARAWLVPTPIDMDTARYHGAFLSKRSETWRHNRRAFIQDLQESIGAQPTDLQYFFDPDVAAVLIHVTILNGDPDSVVRDFTYLHGSYCELAPHLRLKPVRVEYGRGGKWEEFRPIQLRFAVTSGTHVQVSKEGRIVRIAVPASADLEISILPDVNETQLQQTASYAASATQLKLRSLPGFKAASTIVPAVAEQKLRVTHCAKAPATRPAMAGAPSRLTSAGEPIVIAERGRLKQTADIPGYIEVDAASAGQVRIEAAWSDIDDRPEQDHPMLTASTAVSQPRSIVFDRHVPPSASSMARVAVAKAMLVADTSGDVRGTFALQCAENKVFLGPHPDQVQAQVNNRACTLDFADARRKRATVTAVTMSRYKGNYKPGPASEFETRSNQVLVDVPASMRLPAPDISHVLPLSHDVELRDGSAGRTQRIYAMRFYVRPPWLLSGPGERVAIGCIAGAGAQGPVASLDKYITQWGEDPLERPHLDVTRYAPRASNFKVPEKGNPAPLDETFYPPQSIEGAPDVLYRDNLTVTDSTSTSRTVSVASFALRRDSTSKLWFCDVALSDGFLGWCGLALYRHQPHAHEEFQLSAAPAWVYGAVLHGEQIVWVHRAGKLRVTVGPVFDPHMSFELDPRAYFHGISRNLGKADGSPVPLQHMEVEGRTYFEGVVKFGDGPWSLVKRRFGSEVASIGLDVGG